MDHPSDSALLDFAAGGQPPEARAEISAHLDACARCSSFISGLDDTNPGKSFPVDPVVGLELGDYRVVERLGQGGMGVVYRGVHPVIGKDVAIKVLQGAIASDPVLVRRMLEEARAVNAAKHPNIIDIFAFGQLPDGRPYLVMELLEGQSLQELLARHHSLTVPQALSILAEAMAALQAAHATGVIHRDLKPDNIFANPHGERWRVKLLDFGLAKRQGAKPSNLTTPGAVMGTPGFMSPEQVRGSDDISPKTDIYAMGVVLWTMLAGREPFAGGAPVEVMHRHLTMPAPSLKAVAAGVPDALEALTLRMLEKDPARRPGASEVQAAAEALLKDLARGSPLAQLPERPDAEPPKAAVIAGLIALVALVGGALLFAFTQSEPAANIEPERPLDVALLPPPLKKAPPKEQQAQLLPPPPPPPRPLSTEKRWSCANVMAVSPAFEVPNTEWSFVSMTISDEPSLLISSTNDRAGMKKLLALREAIVACQGTTKLVVAKRVNPEHPGFFNNKLHRYTGIEALAGEVSVRSGE